MERKLPIGWASVELGDVIPKPRPKVPPDPKSSLPFIGMDHIESNSFHLTGQSRFSDMKSAGSYFMPGDVLYGRLRPYLNKVHLAKFEGVASAEFIVLPETDVADGKFIKYLLHQRVFVNHAMSRSSGDRPRVKFNGLTDFQFALPPLDEQHRIVEKIETLFARIDKGEEALREVQKLLKRYRQSILKAAVTGELTRDWREANQHKLEPASDLLARILETRREHWQGRGKYMEPMDVDTTDLADLPDGWIWATLDQLICHLTSGSRDWKKYYGRGDGTFIMAQNVRPAHFDESYRVPVDPPEDGPDAIRSEVRLNDLLITIVGANTGDVCRFPLTARKHYVCQSVALIRPTETSLSSFLELYLSAEEAGKKVLDKFIYGAGRPHLSFEQLRSLPVPLPPLAEAAQTTAILETLEERMSKLESEVSAQMKNTTALRQSILKSAFTGQLVPQDPNDEPASELLARIRAEREATPAKAKSRRKARA